MTRAFSAFTHRAAQSTADAEMRQCEQFIIVALTAHGPMRPNDLVRYLERREWPEFWSRVAIKNLVADERLVERDGMLRRAAALYEVPSRFPDHGKIGRESRIARFWRACKRWLTT